MPKVPKGNESIPDYTEHSVGETFLHSGLFYVRPGTLFGSRYRVD